MKRFQRTPAVLLGLLILALFLPGAAPCSDPMPEAQAGVKAINAFAFDLYGQIRKPQGNLVFSPYRISMALAMAYAGARGNTESQMAKALHFSLAQPKMNEVLGGLNAQILSAAQGKDAEQNIANALWGEKSYPLEQDFVKTIRVNYKGDHRQLDFLHSPEPARKTINSWVEEQTKDRIKDLLAPGTISADTRLLLTNAIYFKGIWESQFPKKFTQEAAFTLLDGTEVKVPMMHQAGSFGYFEAKGLQVLEMSYKGGELSMIVLLPSKEQRLEDFEQSKIFDRLGQVVRDLGPQRVKVYLPKFKMTSAFQLGRELVNLGMADAFSWPGADFSGMTGNRDFFIADVVHKAFVEVNEEGAEATAATAGLFRAGGSGKAPVFKADRPFVFLIRHRPSGAILFLGRVTKP